ncbi:fluoride efflux transporter CrcB [Mammaliicoccus stepanovicii]|uniref:Fluoride-specific ion channel FluC n=1 Tax=Mammaliicoccus stepanovicii TaxID=643214 RepID=A0A239YX93_9STAP|nr:fluoride efflux transporter CrcB [Mammaliicoccus stepanovicii]PNZ75370.1 fluoride efflux transporter CrcB [Mammaliicoccus stepanovicii]GGI40549.1 putative fluoride ion transporter CrcB 1 [Mammaliicoccus stepanovicii]SNV63422.1 CrcB family protein [Mammaliicoccus stepanovicii]
MLYIAIFIGGAFGGGLRYLVSLTIMNSEFPYATFIVNIIGALLMGIFTTYFLTFFKSHPIIHKMITTGFLGALTTYSSMSLEVIHFIEHGQMILAIFYIMISMLFGIMFMAIGYKKGIKQS